MTDDSEKAGLTILHYGMLAAVVVNLILSALLLFTVRSNQKIAITAEAFARTAAEDRVTDEELRKRIEAMEQE